jgi:hypothetical protein
MDTLTNAHALVVGIDDYTGPGVPPLPRTVRQDAEDIEKLLVDPGRCGYATSRVHSLLGRDATRDAIRKGLDDLKAATHADSTVFLYFSCHGCQLKDGEYLMPADADASSEKSVAATALSAAEFSDRLKAVPARRLLLVLDCCHAAGVAALKGREAGPGLKAGLSEDAHARLFTGSGRAILAACTPNEQAVVLRPGDRNSLFTTHLLEGLRGKASTDDGLVKVLGLWEYVQLQVVGRWHAQNPVLKADLQNNFAVALNNAREKGVSARGPEERYRYDVFIAHAELDFDWVFDQLMPALDREGLRHTVSSEFLGQSRVTAVEEAITKSKFILLIISPHYTPDRLIQLAGILGQEHGLRQGTHQLIPVKIAEPTEEVRLGIQALVGVDLTHTGRRREFEMNRLLKHLHKEPSTW